MQGDRFAFPSKHRYPQTATTSKYSNIIIGKDTFLKMAASWEKKKFYRRRPIENQPKKETTCLKGPRKTQFDIQHESFQVSADLTLLPRSTACKFLHIKILHTPAFP